MLADGHLDGKIFTKAVGRLDEAELLELKRAYEAQIAKKFPVAPQLRQQAEIKREDESGVPCLMGQTQYEGGNCMNVSYEGIGQWAATFACDGVSAGQVVKVSGNGTVAKCADNDGFEGVVLSVARDGKACSVAMGGMVTVSYTGASAPAAGWNSLAADGSGGVKVVSDGGKGYLAVEVDTTAKTVTIVL